MRYIYNIMIRVIISLVFVFSIVFGLRKCVNDKITQKNTTIEKKLDSLQNVVDSLANEVFIHKTNVDRYEITVERLRERDSIAAQKLEDILYKEVE